MKGIQVTTETMKNKARFYVKKPLPIRAMQIDQIFWVETLEGNFQAKEGDYLLEGIQGELYACRKDIFEASYELLNEKRILVEQQIYDLIIKSRDEK